jgi:hypothetical protein
MSSCKNLKHLLKYSRRNSPPFSASDCKSQTKIGNDGNKYSSKVDKNGTYKWVKSTQNNKTKKNRSEETATMEDLRNMAKRYKVTFSGTKKAVAERIFMMTHRGRTMNRTDYKKVEPFISATFLRYLKKYNM